MARNKNIKERLLITAATVGILLAASGCQNDCSADKDFFGPASESPVKKMCDAQAAAGAQEDATLYPTHFDGNALNSLGQAKLDLITSTLPDEGPITIYIQAPTGTSVPTDQAKTRSDAVTQYLLNSHLATEQFKLVDGPNTTVCHMSGTAINDMGKTDTGEASNQTGSSASTASGASAAAH